MNELKPDDFPVMSQGDRVYAKTQSSPIATCLTDAMAVEIAHRLNLSDIALAGADDGN